MKVSLKLEDHHQQTQTQTQTQTPIHFKAKIPITVFTLPFLSGFSATHNHSSPSSDKLSLSLRTHFSSGPTLKLSYNTTLTTTAAPFTLTLKSGVSLSGSPNNSPLIITANFSISPQNPNPNPNFTIQFKPRLGSFSLRKSIPSTVPKKGAGENSFGFVPLDRPNIWKELTVDSVKKDSILAGILVAADTELPVTKRVKVKLRWGVGVSSKGYDDNKLPYLRVNKIKVERVEFDDDVKEENVDRKRGEFEMLKGMCSWMRGELNDLRKENGEMRGALEEIVSQRSLLKNWDECGGGGKRGVGENLDGFERWKMKANGQREMKQTASCSSDVESELQKAIKAASAQ